MDRWKGQTARWKVYQSRDSGCQVNRLSSYHNETDRYLIELSDFETPKIEF